MKLGNIMIFGDSYSTFEGYIPEGYELVQEAELTGEDLTTINIWRNNKGGASPRR